MTKTEIPERLLHSMDGFLGLILHRGDTDREWAQELHDEITRYTRKRDGERRPFK